MKSIFLRLQVFLLLSLTTVMAAQDACPYDLNGDGFIGAGEIVQFIGGYGVPSFTEGDFNDNGVPDFEDVRIFSRYQGYNCPTPVISATSGYFQGLVVEPIDTLSADLVGIIDTLPAGAVTYRLYAEVSDPDVAVAAVWGDEAHPLTLNAPDGLQVSSLSNMGSGFANNVDPLYFPVFPTLEKTSWWALDQAPEDDPDMMNTLINPAIDFGTLLANGALELNSSLGEGWFRYGNLMFAPDLPTASSLKLLGQFTTLGQGGLCGTLNLELRVINDDGSEAFEEVFGAAFQSPGAETLCEAEPECPEGVDLNGDGLVATSDLLQLLEDFGTTNSGPSDINGDGAVNVTDILTLLGSFGMICD